MISIESWDDRRDIIILPTTEEAIQFAAEHWIHSAKRAIHQKGRFAVALSGGSTPKAIYKELAKPNDLSWEQVFLFWSDERGVPPTDPDSNYKMAIDSGLGKLPIPPAQIFRMKTEDKLEKHAEEYEHIIRRHLDKRLFDLVMLGVGEDGHTASLFPNTDALHIENKLVTSLYLPQKNSHRMTLTFPCIQQSHRAVIYALGKSKQEIVPTVLNAPIVSPYPASRIGTPQNKALWIVDFDAGALLKKEI